MRKKVLALVTSFVAALAVVGVAWAGTDDGTSTSVTSAGASTSSTGVTVTSVDDTSPTTGATVPEDTTATTARVGTTSTSEEDRSSSSSSTSTSIATSTSTSDGAGSTTSTSMGSSTSTSIDDSDGSNVADQVTTHKIPGVGTVTIEVSQGVLYLSSVSAPGWDIERDKVEPDRIELEFTSGEAKAEFEARLRAGGVDIKIEVDAG